MTNWTGQQIYNYWLTLPESNFVYTAPSPFNQLARFALVQAVPAVYGTGWAVWIEFNDLVNQYFGGAPNSATTQAYHDWVNTCYYNGGSSARFVLTETTSQNVTYPAGVALVWDTTLNPPDFSMVYPASGIPPSSVPPTPTPTFVPSPLPTPSPTPGSPSPTPTPSPGVTPTPSPGGSPSPTPTPGPIVDPALAARWAAIASALGNPLHDIVLRSSVDVTIQIPFVYNTLPFEEFGGLSDNIDVGWIAWNDPTSNPNTGPKPPLNQWEPFAGDWVPVGNYLIDLAQDIKSRIQSRWTWFDGLDYTPYRSIWKPWKLVTDQIIERRYNIPLSEHDAFFVSNFSFPNQTILDLQLRLDVYVNDAQLPKGRYTLELVNTVPVLKIKQEFLQQGYTIRTRLRYVPPTPEELAFDPDVQDLDPLVVWQRTYDYPYTYEERRDIISNKSVKNYYFWVKDKEAPARGNVLSIKHVAALLREHDGTYSVPQVYKFYNQLDGRPNRYALLSIKNLGRWVRKLDTYKLRLTKNPTLRDDDHDTKLKNLHAEWLLLRPYQGTRIPRALWDRLTDTLCGVNSIGQDLPYVPYEDYDRRNKSFASYGLNVGQVMGPVDDARATVKGTILNTGVTRYDDATGELVADPISFSGFDIEQLDTYLATPTSIRAFMDSLWRNAKPKQVNELFFAVLYDTLAKSPELSDMFKTSYIALSEVRTIAAQEAAEIAQDNTPE